MNLSEALQFLQENQPLPPTLELGERIVTFDEARKLLQTTLDANGLRLLLGAFGEGDGFGVYPLVEGTALAYAPAQVIPILKQHLSSPFPGVRYWNAQIAASFPSETLVDALENLLDGDFDTRYAVISALGQIKSARSRTALSRRQAVEDDVELRALITAELAI
ncbi:HEAT repeat domain-containing protein [Deinococcus arenicola]|uniref:HEAT repeat domain-containing protein n=1 Tax=Deinococcus arenicola TaxID=2994950 RepID=A0ABU4DLR7_9DEIO|nr:HEAT repeat domain-containing protein [Deinococcus sp. ZS9-10]MDV6373362.1 HEAT repeat domain-containing protein [Deinococcus sp. ZS9-10]